MLSQSSKIKSFGRFVPLRKRRLIIFHIGWCSRAWPMLLPNCLSKLFPLRKITFNLSLLSLLDLQIRIVINVFFPLIATAASIYSSNFRTTFDLRQQIRCCCLIRFLLIKVQKLHIIFNKWFKLLTECLLQLKLMLQIAILTVFHLQFTINLFQFTLEKRIFCYQLLMLMWLHN